MANLTPKQVFPTITPLAPGDPIPVPGIFIPLSDLPGLTPEEADPYTGDLRKIMYEINKTIVAAIAKMEAAQRPTKFNITRGIPTGVNPTTIRQIYTATFDLDINSVDVSAE